MNVRLVAGAIVIFSSTVVGASLAPEPVVSVRETDGTYTVSARFTVPEGAAVVRDVLTDYPAIPRFMPDVRSSRVLDRLGNTVRVEQHAVAKYLMFSKEIHLVLGVEEGTDTIRFRDRLGESFTRYEGAWTIRAGDGLTDVEYALTATPAFGVPGFVLRKLLDRDARVMIDRLRLEIAARAVPE